MLRSTLNWMAALSLVACNGNKGGDTSSSQTTDTAIATLCDPTPVPCQDQMILDLSLHGDKVSDGAVETTTDGDDFVTTIDASAGGYNAAANNPWVYVKFTPEGAERVDIDDETALESQDWDLSARRFILRLNGGSSGPSCVGATAVQGQSYSDLTSVPDGVSYSMDDYYTDDCTIINDSSGLPGSPQVVLGPWWGYNSCVTTTGTPFLIQLADGQVIKLVVESYYGSGQDECNSTGTPGSDSAHYTIRWRYLQ